MTTKEEFLLEATEMLNKLSKSEIEDKLNIPKIQKLYHDRKKNTYIKNLKSILRKKLVGTKA